MNLYTVSGVAKIFRVNKEVAGMKKIYTATQVAELLQVKKSYVYELIASKRLKFIRLSERRIRIPESALEEYLTEKLN